MIYAKGNGERRRTREQNTRTRRISKLQSASVVQFATSRLEIGKLADGISDQRCFVAERAVLGRDGRDRALFERRTGKVEWFPKEDELGTRRSDQFELKPEGGKIEGCTRLELPSRSSSEKKRLMRAFAKRRSTNANCNHLRSGSI